MNIVLIGYRGSGKTTVGRLLAERLNRPLVDTDALIEWQAGMTIREIFATRGETGFRDLEARVIEEVAAADGQIISAGGGAILRESNVTAMKRNGRLVLLTAPPEVLWARISADAASRATRPNLTSSGGLEEVREVLARRGPLYAAAADLTIDTTDRPADAIVDLIIQQGRFE